MDARTWDRMGWWTRAWGLVVGVGLLATVATSASGNSTSSGAGGRKEARVELGRRLFFDPRVSRNGVNACSACHLAEHGFSDPRVVSADETGPTLRHSQTLLFSAEAPGVHWDGVFRSVEELAFGRLQDPGGTRAATTGLSGRRVTVAASRAPGRTSPTGRTPTPTVYYAPSIPGFRPAVTAVTEGALYADAFQAAYGDPEVTTDRLAKAIAAYVETIRPTEGPYDRYVAGDEDALSPAAQRGLALFRGRAGCASCHSMRGPDAAFTDFQFHDTGVAWDTVPVEQKRSARSPKKYSGIELGDPGYMAVTGRNAHARAFKTPTLRDVALRPPYMHDGRFETLRQVVDYYADGGSGDPLRDRRIKGFEATDADLSDLVAFLECLTGDRRPGLASSLWTHRAEKTRIRVTGPQGRPLAEQWAAIRPAGDPLPGGEAESGWVVVRQTDREGWLEFEPFHWTHASVKFAGQDLMIPDTCTAGTLVVR